MRKDIALIVMCIGILLFGCSNQENPSDDKLLENEKVETTAPVVETAEPTAPLDETAAPAETVVPTTEPTVVPTTEPTIVPTVEPTVEPTVKPTIKPTVAPTKQPTKAPVVTKTPTKKPVVTKAPTKAPATKKPVTTKNPNAAGEPYKVGHVTVTPVKGVTMWSRNHGIIRTKPWTTEDSEIVGHQYFSVIEVTGLCSNGFVQYKMNWKGKERTVYTHEDQLYKTKPKEFTFKGYDPKEVIKKAHKKLEAKGFDLVTANTEEIIEEWKEDIKKDKQKLKEIEEGTFDFVEVNCWTKEEEDAYTDELKQLIVGGEKKLAEYEQHMLVDIYKYEPINDPYEELGSFESATFNINLNRMEVHPSVTSSGVETMDDIVNSLVEIFEFNRENDTVRQDYVWIYYGIVEHDGETYYRFYCTGLS